MTARSETEALLRRYYDAFNAGDVDGMLACLSEDVRHDVNEGAARVGKAAFSAFCAHMARCYQEQLEDMRIFASEDGGRGAAEFTVQGKYVGTDDGLPEATGQRYNLPAGAFFTVEGGLIARVTTYYNLRDWIRQVAGE